MFHYFGKSSSVALWFITLGLEGSKPTGYIAGFKDPTLLRDFQWPFKKKTGWNAVIIMCFTKDGATRTNKEPGTSWTKQNYAINQEMCHLLCHSRKWFSLNFFLLFLDFFFYLLPVPPTRENPGCLLEGGTY